MGGIVVGDHFIELWRVISIENSKIKAFPFFFWVFFPVLLFASAANITDVRLLAGTIAWAGLAYICGSLVVATGTKRIYSKSA